MALLQEINYNPAEDTMQDVFDKINTAIQSINSVLGGGSTGQSVRKVDGTDFNYEFFDAGDVELAAEAEAINNGDYVIRTKVLPIGSWNMDSTDSVFIPHGLGSDISKVISVTALIRKDDGNQSFMFNQYGNAGGGSGIGYISGANVKLYRAVFLSTPLEIFDSTDFNDSVMNRGWITINYVD